MLWVYGHYKCFTFSVRGTTLHTKASRRAERVKHWAVEIYNVPYWTSPIINYIGSTFKSYFFCVTLVSIRVSSYWSCLLKSSVIIYNRYFIYRGLFCYDLFTYIVQLFVTDYSYSMLHQLQNLKLFQ